MMVYIHATPNKPISLLQIRNKTLKHFKGGVYKLLTPATSEFMGLVEDEYGERFALYDRNKSLRKYSKRHYHNYRVNVARTLKTQARQEKRANGEEPAEIFENWSADGSYMDFEYWMTKD